MSVSKVKPAMTVYTPSRAMEWLCACIAGGFAVSCLSGPLFSTGMQWTRFEEFGTETEWGLFIGAVAVVRVTALIVNGNYRRTPAARVVTALIGAGLFAFMSSLFLVPGVPLNSGFFTYGFLAIGDLVSAWRSAKDAATADWIWGYMARPEAQPAAMPDVLPHDWRNQ